MPPLPTTYLVKIRVQLLGMRPPPRILLEMGLLRMLLGMRLLRMLLGMRLLRMLLGMRPLRMLLGICPLLKMLLGMCLLQRMLLGMHLPLQILLEMHLLLRNANLGEILRLGMSLKMTHCQTLTKQLRNIILFLGKKMRIIPQPPL
jgi:hypothetical protein